MDSKQIDMAMKNRLPVIYDGTRYDRIIEYVCWYDNNGKRRLSVVLLKDRCSVRVPTDRVQLAET